MIIQYRFTHLLSALLITLLVSALLILSFRESKLTRSTAFVERDGSPTLALASLLQLAQVQHNGGLSSMIDATSEAWIDNKEKFGDLPADARVQFMSFFKQLGMVDTITPKGNDYRYALVHSASGRDLEHLKSLWIDGLRFGQVVVIDDSMPLEIPKAWQAIVVRSLDEWVASGVRPGKILQIAAQPGVVLRDTMVRAQLPDGFTLETVGPAARFKIEIGQYLEVIPRLLDMERTWRMGEHSKVMGKMEQSQQGLGYAVSRGL